MSDQSNPGSISSSHQYRDHLVITKHQPQELELLQGDRPTIGAHLIRPYPEARILFIDHVDHLFYVYWVDQRLMLPQLPRSEARRLRNPV